jgi:hypothetical protein
MERRILQPLRCIDEDKMKRTLRQFTVLLPIVGIWGCSQSNESTDSPQQERLSPKAQLVANRQYFDSEPRDEAWASSREDKIRSALSGVELRITDLECRATLCRVVLVFDSENALLEFESKLLPIAAKGELYLGGVSTLTHQDAPARTLTWWISRPGHRFPMDGRATRF